MTRQRIVQAATALVLLAAAGIVVWRKNRAQTSEPSPQDAVYSMQNAARAGDVKSYLAAFTGPMQASLRQSGSSEASFKKYLEDSTAGIKGVVVSEPEKITEAEVKLRVEYVYQDRNEAQLLYLEKLPDGWKISRADAGERLKTLVPYGTRVK